MLLKKAMVKGSRQSVHAPCGVVRLIELGAAAERALGGCTGGIFELVANLCSVRRLEPRVPSRQTR